MPYTNWEICTGTLWLVTYVVFKYETILFSLPVSCVSLVGISKNNSIIIAIILSI